VTSNPTAAAGARSSREFKPFVVSDIPRFRIGAPWNFECKMLTPLKSLRYYLNHQPTDYKYASAGDFN
jgi:hypothetical protein